MRTILAAGVGLLVFLTIVPATPAADVPMAPGAHGVPGVKGKIDAVTVYRGQALVTRLVEVGGGAGLREVVVTDLPEQIVPTSIYAEPAGGVEIRSVSYRERPVEQDVREEVRKLDDSIRQTQDHINADQREVQLLAEQKQFLDKLANFTAPTAQVEMTKGVLNAETLQKLTGFQFDSREKISQQELKLGLEARNLNESLKLLQEQREKITNSSEHVAREAVVFLSVAAAGRPAAFRLRYLVGEASWDPSYNIRAAADHKQVSVEFLASIQQMSGEDWDQVTMTLSTATPSLTAKAPELAPLTVTLVARPHDLANIQRDLEQLRKEIAARQTQAEQNYNSNNFAPNSPGANSGSSGSLFGSSSESGRKTTGETNNTQDAELNSVAGESQMLDLQQAQGKPRRSKGAARGAGEGVSVTYEVSGRTSLPSRPDRQLIQIASLPMKAEFYKIATPLLTRYVYDEAAVTNDGKVVLLAGPVSTYAAGQFVGNGAAPTVAIGESFTVGFGIDSSLRTGRELAEKSESTQGGNTVMNFTYRLTLENFGEKPAAVRLFDRLPTARDNEVKVTLGKTTDELSTDAAYQQTGRKRGLLRWDVETPAQAIGPKARVIEYDFILEHDRQMTIGQTSVDDASGSMMKK